MRQWTGLSDFQVMAVKNRSSISSGLFHFNMTMLFCDENIDGLVQERRKSSALAMELRLSCTKPSNITRDDPSSVSSTG